jgi:hypothetical protein
MLVICSICNFSDYSEVCELLSSWYSQRLKGTVLRDRFRKCRRKLPDLGLNKGGGWFLNFSDAPLIFS